MRRLFTLRDAQVVVVFVVAYGVLALAARVLALDFAVVLAGTALMLAIYAKADR